MDSLPTFLDEKWPNSKGGKCRVNIPYMEHFGEVVFFLALKICIKSISLKGKRVHSQCNGNIKFLQSTCHP